MLKTLLMIGAGGFIGSTTRYLIFKGTESIFSSHYPLGTFIVNVVGCLLLGAIYAISDRWGFGDPDVKLMLTLGVCGGFTTFSTFINENYNLFIDGRFLVSAVYIILSLTIGLVCVKLGHALVNLF